MAGVPGALRAQAITGRFIDATTEDGVPFVRVEVRNAEGILVGGSSSDSEGGFRVNLRESGGPLQIRGFHLAYEGPGVESLFVEVGQVLELPPIPLDPTPIVLDSLFADAPPAPWVTQGEEMIRRNQLLGKGTFLAGALIEVRKPDSLTEHIAEASGLSVRDNPGGLKALWYPESLNGRDCIEVLLNRWPLLYPIDDIPLAGVAGIEIYKDAIDVPEAYSWDFSRNCGVVNIWLWNSWR